MTGCEPGFGVYVHWPFCAAKCPYCDFNSHVRHQPVDQERFALAFDTELETMRARTGPREVTSIFLGGGTPSLMQPETVANVLDSIARHWTVPDDIEVTLEANPSSVEAERFHGYRAAGVNRVSLGVQALNDADLRFLGRLHNVSEALHAIELARVIFPRLSFDLIYARPNQTPVTRTSKPISAALIRRREFTAAPAHPLRRGVRAVRRSGRIPDRWPEPPPSKPVAALP